MSGPSDPGLAGERTTLAWARMGLTLLGVPAALLAYASGRNELAVAAAAVAMVLGLGVLVGSVRRQRVEPGLLQPTRPRVLARRDARGVATLHALPPGTAWQPGELPIELTPKDGSWVLVTDAWFFSEGEAARWAAARYGEFRVDASGRALLVGLRGAQLQPL